MSQSTLERGARGGGVVLLGSFATMAIQFTAVIVLSRLLTPEDFGLVAMVAVFVTLGTLLRDFGLPLAALQAKSLSHQESSNLFWMNSALAALAASGVALSAPLLARLYAEPRLSIVVPAMGLAILVTGIGAQIQVLLARRMRFKTIALTDVFAQFLGLVVAVSLAYYGAGYWALVTQTLTTAIVTLLGRWIASRWFPSRFRRGHGALSMLRVGAGYGVAQILTFLQGNAEALVIGIRFDASALGVYNRGQQVLAAPAGRLLSPLAQVVVATLNQARSEGRPYEAVLLRIQFMVGFGITWLFAMAAGTAARLIPLVLGEGWDSTIPIFQILAISGFGLAYGHVRNWIFLLDQRSGDFLRYNLISKPITIACILIGSGFGLEGVAWGYSIGMTLSWPIGLWWLRKGPISPLDYAKDGALVAGSSFIAGIVASLVTSSLTNLPALLAIPIGVSIGTGVMIAFLALFSKGRHHMVAAVSLAMKFLRK